MYTISVSINIEGGKRDPLHFAERRFVGKLYVIDMFSLQFDTLLRLADAEKNVLAVNNDIGPGNLNSRIVLTPKEDATYRIIATSLRQRGVGAYTLTIREFRK